MSRILPQFREVFSLRRWLVILVSGAWMLSSSAVDAWSFLDPTSASSSKNEAGLSLHPTTSSNNDKNDPLPPLLSSRRHILSQGVVSVATLASFPSHSLAATTETSTSAVDVDDAGGIMSATQVAELLRTVPTFTIVDPKGVPFMVVGEDAKVTGYFFTTYPEAERILKLAKTSADKAIKQAKAENSQEEIGDNPWNKARISTVSLVGLCCVHSNPRHNCQLNQSNSNPKTTTNIQTIRSH